MRVMSGINGLWYMRAGAVERTLRRPDDIVPALPTVEAEQLQGKHLKK